MVAITSLGLEAADPATAETFYAAAFGDAVPVDVRAARVPTSGFRSFTISLVVSQPSTVDVLVGAAAESGGTVLKPAAKSFWGYGGVVRAPDGAIWKVATSTKKDKGPATRDVDDVVLLLGVSDVKASKKFYVEQDFTVGKSFGSKYVEFETRESHVRLALYPRRSLAKDAGVDVDGGDARGLVIGSDAGAFTDPDGFVWETV